MTIIKACDFILRPVTLNDAESLYELQQDIETKRNLIHVPKSIASARSDIIKNRRKNKTFHESFIIEMNGQIAGEISFRQTDEYNKAKARISYWIAKAYRNKGISTKAVKIITKYAFIKYKLVRMEANVRTFNKASARVLEKAGYRLEGILKKNKFKNGKFLDDMLWAKVK
jgi:ribosomal-protein-alanine N-acetyltransferase